MNIPIYPGSSSFFPGNTPFGFYDNDYQFQVDADKVVTFCARRLGYPIMEVELQDINFYTAFEEAITTYGNELYAFQVRDNLLNVLGASTASVLNHSLLTPTMAGVIRLTQQYAAEAGAGGNIEWYRGSIPLTASVLLMPVSYDIQVIQAIEFNDQVRKSAYSFELINNKLRIFPIPDRSIDLWFQYIKIDERANSAVQNAPGRVTNVSNINFANPNYTQINSIGRQWIFEYTLALCKEILGYIRGKYSQVPIPNREVTLNQSDLLQSAKDERIALIERLRAYFDETSRQALLARKQAESDSAMNELGKSPMQIYIG